ncbi:hypothetical protein KBB89_01665 [Candidatus Gracilibacteria bacterium]|nr:hypothetical protein [Candidatus Gracilibacteria bacterium]
MSFFFLSPQAYAADCVFGGGDIRSEFKNCNTSIGPRSQSNIDLDVTQNNSDFRTITAAVIRRVQIVTSVIAIGVIVWIGMILVLPVSSEAKEKAKSKVLSVVFGFLAMIAATIVVNGIINLLYEIFR